MSAMKKILLPTDFSNNAWNALFTSLKLYTDVACHFYLLNAHEPNFANLMGNKGKQRLGFIYDSMEAYSNQELDKMLDYLKKTIKIASTPSRKFPEPMIWYRPLPKWF